jgi:hypothetical protein
MNALITFAFGSLLLFSDCSSEETCGPECAKPSSTEGTVSPALAQNKNKEISCKLSSTEMQIRRQTVLNELKRKVRQKKELPDGYAFRFPGDDKTVDELTDFIKSERTCCGFFIFGLSVAGDASEAWLNLTGPKGTKEMIEDELGL